MAVTLYRQVGKGKARRYQKVNLGRGRRPADLTGPYFLRSLTAPVRGNTAATTSMRQSPPGSVSTHISKLLRPTSQSSKTRMKLGGRRSRMLCINGSPSFNSSKAKTSRARARRRCGHTTTASASSSTSRAEQPALPRPDRPQAASALREVSSRT
jgi:hypothetical protein